MANIIIKNYEHFNRALGTPITSRAHYEKEMHKQGCVPFEEGQNIVDKARRGMHMPYVLSDKAETLVRQVAMKDKKGFKLSDREIDAMKDIGVSINRPEDRGTQGGFE